VRQTGLRCVPGVERVDLGPCLSRAGGIHIEAVGIEGEGQHVETAAGAECRQGARRGGVARRRARARSGIGRRQRTAPERRRRIAALERIAEQHRIGERGEESRLRTELASDAIVEIAIELVETLDARRTHHLDQIQLDHQRQLVGTELLRQIGHEVPVAAFEIEGHRHAVDADRDLDPGREVGALSGDVHRRKPEGQPEQESEEQSEGVAMDEWNDCR